MSIPRDPKSQENQIITYRTSIYYCIIARGKRTRRGYILLREITSKTKKKITIINYCYIDETP